MKRIFLCAVSFFLLSAAICFASSVRDFQKELIGLLDSQLSNTAQHINKGIERQSNPGRGLTYDLWAMCIMHEETGDQRYFDWALKGFTYYSRSYRDKDGSIGISSGARNVTPFCLTYDYLKSADALNDEDISVAEEFIEACMKKASTHTDWGGHNRAIIEACAAFACARSYPDALNAEKWRKRGEALSKDAFNHWSIEDASIYQPFWMWYMLKAADINGKISELMDAVTTRYYFDYYKMLQTPAGMMPDWGDGDPTHMWEWYMADLVHAGNYYDNGEYLYAAWKIYEFYKAHPVVDGNPMVIASALKSLLGVDANMKPYKLVKSHEALEELVGKKIVFRNADDAYMLFNYRDLGNFGRYQRDYLNQALEAFEEKQHHGHADENSIISLISQGTILLHDGGYRKTATDGWRADVYHNRVLGRNGWPVDFEQDSRDIVSFLEYNKVYQPVETQKIHFASFDKIDYSRTRLIDKTRGYTSDRVVIFFKEAELYIVVDSILADTDGPKSFTNMWHPSNIISKGELSGNQELEKYIVAWPEKIGIRDDYMENAHTRELLIQFLDNRDKITAAKTIERNFNPSECFYQWVKGWFYKGMRFNFITVLRPHRAGGFSKDMLDDIVLLNDGSHVSGMLGLSVNMSKGAKAVVGLKLDMNIGLANLRGRPLADWKSGSLEYGELKTDADFAYVITDDNVTDYGFVNASIISFKRDILFEMPVQKDIEMWQGASAGYSVPDLRDRMPVYSDTISK